MKIARKYSLELQLKRLGLTVIFSGDRNGHNGVL